MPILAAPSEAGRGRPRRSPRGIDERAPSPAAAGAPIRTPGGPRGRPASALSNHPALSPPEPSLGSPNALLPTMSSDSPEAALPPFARALGRVPSGLYLVATNAGDAPLGFVGSFVMQQGFQPPTISVAVGKDRDHLAAMRGSGSFTISILDPDSSNLMGAFFKKYEDGETAFDHVDTAPSPSGVPVLTGALAWLECKVTGEHETGDHVVVFGEVTAGEMLREGEPSTHVRKNGLSY